MSGNIVKPEPADELTKETRAFWREIGQNLVKDSVKTIDETAKQIIGVAGILEGLYFHAIAYKDLLARELTWGEQVIYLLPVLFLLLSLSAALLVFFPHRYKINIHSSEASRKAHKDIVESKLRMLRAASIMLMAGVAGFLPAIYIYLIG